MKNLSGKKGFTLVELLAVIVVLGIVMVLATTTVLPLMQKSQKSALATEANSLVEAASQVVSLVSIGEYDGTYNGKTASDYSDGYCFTVTDLVNAGLWKKTDTTEYAGFVIVKKSDNNYTYSVSLNNGTYAVTITGNADGDDVTDYDSNNASNYVCPAADNSGKLPE